MACNSDGTRWSQPAKPLPRCQGNRHLLNGPAYGSPPPPQRLHERRERPHVICQLLTGIPRRLELGLGGWIGDGEPGDLAIPVAKRDGRLFNSVVCRTVICTPVTVPFSPKIWKLCEEPPSLPCETGLGPPPPPGGDPWPKTDPLPGQEAQRCHATDTLDAVKAGDCSPGPTGWLLELNLGPQLLAGTGSLLLTLLAHSASRKV